MYYLTNCFDIYSTFLPFLNYFLNYMINLLYAHCLLRIYSRKLHMYFGIILSHTNLYFRQFSIMLKSSHFGWYIF